MGRSQENISRKAPSRNQWPMREITAKRTWYKESQEDQATQTRSGSSHKLKSNQRSPSHRSPGRPDGSDDELLDVFGRSVFDGDHGTGSAKVRDKFLHICIKETSNLY